MAKATDIKTARAVAIAAMREGSSTVRRKDAPLVATSFTLPVVTAGQKYVGAGLVDKLVEIRDFKKFGFTALVVVGDQKGRVGYGQGKAGEKPDAIRKAIEAAKRDMIFVSIHSGHTLHHNVEGRWRTGHVELRSATPGTGIVAGAPIRAVFETLGMKNVVARSTGSASTYDIVRATFEALKKEQRSLPRDPSAA